MQKTLKENKESTLLFHEHALTTLHHFGTSCSDRRTESGNSNYMYRAVFANASHLGDANQLLNIVGLLFGNVIRGSAFHPLALSLQKSKRRVRTTPAVHILVTREATDEIFTYECILRLLFESCILYIVFIDSQDMYHL